MRTVLALALALTLAVPALAQRRPPQPPVRQPFLIAPIAEEEPRDKARPAEPPLPVTRPSTPAEGEMKFHDPSGAAFGQLQRPHQALAGFALDRAGLVDWSAALASGRIRPRGTVTAEAAPRLHDLDVVMRNTKEMPWVRFPHRAHSLWLDCGSCHPAPFAEKAGAAVLTMERIFRGEGCGMCHGKVAFPAWQQCERCHSGGGPGAAGPSGGPPTSR